MMANGESDTVVTTVRPEHLTKTDRGEAVTFLEAISEGLFEEMVADDTVFLIGEDIGVYGGAFKVTRGFLDYFGERRVIDAPIAEGGDLTIVTYGMMVHRSTEAADELEREDGVRTEILDLRTLLPMDDEAVIESVKKTGRLLVVHEDTRTGGIAGEIAMRVSESAFEWLDAPMLRVTAIDSPVPFSGVLEDYFLPQTEDIVKAARYLVKY